MPRLNSKGAVAQILILLVLLAGLLGGYFLVQNTQIFAPKASSENVTWLTPVGSVGQDPDNCIGVKDGQQITTCTKVKFRVDVPVQVK